MENLRFTKVLLNGCSGYMGRSISSIAKNYNVEIVCGIDIVLENGFDYPIYKSTEDLKENFDSEIDAIIDFSMPKGTSNIIRLADEIKKPVVICTTGLSSEQISSINALSKKVPVFFSANMSLGVNLIVDLAKKATKLLGQNFDIEIIEKHHNKKLDAPSGTALMIADAIKEERDIHTNYVYDRHNVRKKREKSEIGISAIRGGTIVGEHEIIFAGNNEIVELKHSATSKDVFAAGSLKAATFIKDKEPMLYNMGDLIDEM